MRFSNIFLGIKALLYPQRKELGGVEFNGFGIFDYCSKKKQHQESIRARQSKLLSTLFYCICWAMHGSIYTTNCQISIKYICILDSSVAQRDRTSSPCLCVKMPDLATQENKPPAGYPGDTPTTGKKCFPRTKKKGERGFIEGW
ncbi:hypothetical protein NC651_015137 [Populus alba x Populus x berolinensis]|nr:hypothetical protein NC651_015137 [Populus alba x Populus x berolinensis]